MNYSLLFDSLSKNNVRYVICGGLAVNLHGIPRMTADIDIILDLTTDNISQFEICVKELSYTLSVPVALRDLADPDKRQELKKHKNLIALSFYNYDHNFVALDVLIDFPIVFAKLWEDKDVRKEGAITINLVSLQHLIELKKYSDRLQDQQDVLYLSKIKDGKGK